MSPASELPRANGQNGCMSACIRLSRNTCDTPPITPETTESISRLRVEESGRIRNRLTRPLREVLVITKYQMNAAKDPMTAPPMYVWQRW